MSEKKKASDIILEMQEQLSYLTKIVLHQDSNVKLILSKINLMNISNVENKSLAKSVVEIIEQNVIVNNKEVEEKLENLTNKSNNLEKDFISLKAESVIEQNKYSVFEKMKHEAGIVDDDDELSLDNTRNSQRTQRVKPATNKIVVSQQIFESNKPLPLAVISITDGNGMVINTRSNTKGRWSVPLLPGKYEVHIVKRFLNDTSKSPIEQNFELNVKNVTSGKFEVPELRIESYK